MISRRSLFALFGGAVVAPVVAKAMPEVAAPIEYYDGADSVAFYSGYDAINTGIGSIDTAVNPWWVNRVPWSDAVTRNNSLLAHLMETGAIRESDGTEPIDWPDYEDDE